jgi:hypothetical protein
MPACHDNDLNKACRQGLALRAVDTGQRVLKVGVQTCSVLAEWGWPWGAEATVSPWDVRRSGLLRLGAS